MERSFDGNLAAEPVIPAIPGKFVVQKVILNNQLKPE